VIGEHLKYLATLGERPVAALLWGRAALKVKARDQWIGWSAEERRQGLDRVGNNYRFLVLPWVRVPNLASQVLAATVRRIGADWWCAFGRRLEYLETFVDAERFAATCYLAANWIWVGSTEGSGRRGPRYHYHGQRKGVLLYPLCKKLRRLRQPGRSKEVIGTAPRSPRLALALPHEVEGEWERMQGARPEAGSGLLAGLDAADTKDLAQELSGYCAGFHDVLPRPATRRHMELTMGGLLSGLEKKNTESIALKGEEGVAVRTLQHFMGASPWSDDAVRIRHQEMVAATLGHPEGCLIADGSDFPKKGKDSAGVARQYCGATGKVDNCQAGVFLGYARPEGGATLIDARLYVPKSWFTEEGKRRWEPCSIPEDLEFRTKPELALEMLRGVHSRGTLPARWVLGDEAFGDNPAFLDGIPEGLHYFCEVKGTTRVALPPIPPGAGESSGEPKLLCVQEVATHAQLEWQLAILKQGAHGPLVAQVACLRVKEVRRRGKQSVPGEDVWLFLRRNPKTGEVKHYLSDASEDTRLDVMIRLSAMRWPIETCFQEGKDHLGMDHYQVRSWLGWHHHMTLVMLSHHFLIRLGTRLKKNSRADPSPDPAAPGRLPTLGPQPDPLPGSPNRRLGAAAERGGGGVAPEASPGGTGSCWWPLT
jgi:SRSO17 transposase